MTIRELEPADHSAWHAMRAALWPHCTTERHESEMRDYASHGGRFATFVAVDASGKLCGFVEASLREAADGCETSPVGYIEGIYVTPSQQRRGIGRALVAHAKSWARSRGCQEMGSDCHSDNEASIQFHRNLGFVIAERLIHFRRELPAVKA